MRCAMACWMAILIGGLVGCGFARGFRDRSLEMAGEITADALSEVVAKKLDSDFKELKDALGEIPSHIPKPTSPEEQGLLYTLGGLAAYLVGSLAKGGLRKYAAKKA